MNSGKVLLGVLTGIAVGATLGILFAPDKGSVTRRRVLIKGEDYADSLKQKFDEMVDTITEKYENTREVAEEFVSKGKEKYDGMKKEVENATS